jgi:hypothetical protein
MITNLKNNLTRNQFIELSGLVYTAKNWNNDEITFNNVKLSISEAEEIIDYYRKYNGRITDYGQATNKINLTL